MNRSSVVIGVGICAMALIVGCADPHLKIEGTYARCQSESGKAPFDAITLCSDGTFTAGLHYEGEPRFITGWYSRYVSNENRSHHMLTLHTHEGDLSFPYHLYIQRNGKDEEGLYITSSEGFVMLARQTPIYGIVTPVKIPNIYR